MRYALPPPSFPHLSALHFFILYYIFIYKYIYIISYHIIFQHCIWCSVVEHEMGDCHLYLMCLSIHPIMLDINTIISKNILLVPFVRLVQLQQALPKFAPQEIVTITPEATLEAAFIKLTENNISSLPVRLSLQLCLLFLSPLLVPFFFTFVMVLIHIRILFLSYALCLSSSPSTFF